MKMRSFVLGVLTGIILLVLLLNVKVLTIYPKQKIIIETRNINTKPDKSRPISFSLKTNGFLQESTQSLDKKLSNWLENIKRKNPWNNNKKSYQLIEKYNSLIIGCDKRTTSSTFKIIESNAFSLRELLDGINKANKLQETRISYELKEVK
jgi:hypothetical protein